MSRYLFLFINNLNFAAKIKRYGFLANLAAASLVIMLLVFFSWNSKQLHLPIYKLHPENINLSYAYLFTYSIRTIFRMIVGIVISLIFSLCYASLAAMNNRAEQIMLPILDVLQSVPILGYISFTTAGFIALAPDSTLGFEMVAIFAIFTSQAWNITFGIYQAFKSLPQDLLEVAAIYNFNTWRRFWSIKVPYAIPSMIWNCMISMSGAWFFIVAAEYISYENTQISLPGIGSYIALALAQKNIHAIVASVITMIIIIIAFDQIVFKTLLAWADKFQYSMECRTEHKHWLYSLLISSSFCAYISRLLNKVRRVLINLPFNLPEKAILKEEAKPSRLSEILWICVFCFIVSLSSRYIYSFLKGRIDLNEVLTVLKLTSITFLRILILSILVSLIFLPLSIYIGINRCLCKIFEPIAQLLASLPCNLYFPIFFIYIQSNRANPDIWLSPLLMIGACWYVVFNVIAGASQIPNDFLLIAEQFNIKGILKYRKVLLPAVMPYYITGLITAIGGAWNASIIAEMITWGGQNVYAQGIGSYIAIATKNDDFPRITLGISIMCLVIVILNKVFWQKIYLWVNKKFGYI